MNHLQEFNHNWKPSEEGARVHIGLTIKNYSKLDKLVFHKQMDITTRGLVVAGFTPQRAVELILGVFYLKEMNAGEWIDRRTAHEIIAY
jgi:hypothetical protein